MTEFTSEFIAEQRTLAVALPKRLSVGVVHKNHVNINQNFDTKPIPTKLNVMDVNIFSTMPETCLTAQSICDACNHYPEALDHIEQQAKRIAELEADKSRMFRAGYKRRGELSMFDGTFIEQLESVIGYKPISESHSIADAILNEFMRLNKRIAELEQERQEMDARITAYESDDPYLPIRYEPQPPQESEE